MTTCVFLKTIFNDTTKQGGEVGVGCWQEVGIRDRGKRTSADRGRNS